MAGEEKRVPTPEQAMAENEARLRAIVETAVDGILTIDSRGIVETVNHAAERIFGYAADEMIGRNVSMLMPEPYQSEHDSYLERYLATGERRIIGIGREVAGQRKDGSVFPLELAVSESVVGGRRFFTGLVRDVTERREHLEKLEQLNLELKALNATLEQRVAERTRRLERRSAQLRQMAAELTDAEQRERRRLGALLHDHLQQLLVAARVRVALAHRRAVDPAVVGSLADVSVTLEQAIEAARSLSAQLRPAILHEKGLAAGLHWLAGQFEQQHHLDVRMELETTADALPDLLKVMLYEAVRELLFNVVKHAGVSLATVLMRTTRGGRLHLMVSDGGRGFSPAAQPDARPSTSTGLFSVRERLAALGGRTRISSAPGRGTSVHLSLPLPTEVGLEPAGERRGRRERPGKVRVLIVDDHRIVREGIATLLGEVEGFDVVDQAADGLDGLEKAHRLRPDVVVMDINMPRMDGIEATRRIRAELPDVQVIGLSVRDETGAAEEILDAGAATFLPKSGDPGQLVEAISRCAVASPAGPSTA